MSAGVRPRPWRATKRDQTLRGNASRAGRAVNLACPQARGRLNGLYTGLFFVGGAVGSALAGIAWVEAGRTLVCVVGLMFGVAALTLGSIGPSAEDDTQAARNLRA